MWGKINLNLESLPSQGYIWVVKVNLVLKWERVGAFKSLAQISGCCRDNPSSHPHDPFIWVPLSLISISSVLSEVVCFPLKPVFFLVCLFVLFCFFLICIRENYSFKLKFLPWKRSPNICLCPEFFSFRQDFYFYRPKPWGRLFLLSASRCLTPLEMSSECPRYLSEGWSWCGWSYRKRKIDPGNEFILL